MLNLQGFCRVLKAFPLDGDGRVAVLQSELLNTISEVFLITVELPHTSFPLSLVLCSTWC